ncbi:hypothetical protein ANME2D_00960 [Candidatus Methanoperedens nitroreducens]|uniref:Uncharacterized protein n=1 Tax=Candidatus Methanoperedens nitratireducens TaxID=1392998 RepID=A0A062V065_9EURY|nr:hypothetical protein [Candidatus Methanoperedens nitroreducens]KCZ72531.1 hypothetical protein ANME2D_00960 [Candidatus Methanoperedens nitroreducens]MDJ1423535.1 hypothetical protein [Candidatus Methanoperedens sp.]
MGLLDTLLGRSKLPKPKPDRLFAMSTAYITLSTNLNLISKGAGICFRPIEASRFRNAQIEISELLQRSCQETNTTYKMQKDSYGYLWVILNDEHFEDLVATLYLVSQTLAEHGFDEQLLCAVFKFGNESTVYWIYNYKQARFYPFVPKGKQRDSTYEFRLRSVMDKELPIEKDVERWYPLWDIPV